MGVKREKFNKVEHFIVTKSMHLMQFVMMFFVVFCVIMFFLHGNSYALIAALGAFIGSYRCFKIRYDYNKAIVNGVFSEHKSIDLNYLNRNKRRKIEKTLLRYERKSK
jgi:uncharacterized membrane protein